MKSLKAIMPVCSFESSRLFFQGLVPNTDPLENCTYAQSLYVHIGCLIAQ